MKIPLIGNEGAFADNITGDKDGQGFVSLGESTNVNWFPSLDKNSKSGLTLRPTYGYSATAVSPTSGTGCAGGTHIEGVAYFVFGKSLFRNSTKQADDFATAPTDVIMAHAGDVNNRQILIVDNSGNLYCYSVTNNKMWKLDGTITDTGTADTNTFMKLDVSTGGGENFTSSGVKPGMTIHNKTDNTWAFITAIDSDNVLSLSADIFPDGNEDYEIAHSYNDSAASACGGAVPFTTPKSCTFMDNFFIVDDQADTSTGRFYFSSLTQDEPDCTRWDTDDYQTANRFPDKIQCVKAVNRELWLIGVETTEVWYNAGLEDNGGYYQFLPIQNAFFQWGVKSQYTVTQVGNEVMWLGSNSGGGYNVVKSNGLDLEIVSTPEIASNLTSITSGDYGNTYGMEGHTFYVLTNASRTFVYDLTTKMWHRWSSSDGANAVADYPAHASRVIVPKNLLGGTTESYYMGHTESNNLLTMDRNKASEDGNTIQRIRRSKVIHADGKGMIFRAVQIDCDEESTMAHGSFFTSSDSVIDTNATFTGLGITEDADYIKDSYGVTNVIDTVTSAIQLALTDNITDPDGVRGYVVYQADGTRLYPTSGLKLRWRDSGGKWTTAKERLPDTAKSRFIWRALGRSHERTYEVSFNDHALPIISDAFAIIEIDDRDL